jgi:hypothetical protein
MTNGCRVLLLRLADSMNPNGVVSIPRSQLADEFGVAPARITENITLAKKLGFLGTVRRGRPGVTAVYQGQIPDANMVRKPGGDLIRESVPSEGTARYATAGSQVVTTDGTTKKDPTRGDGTSKTPRLPESDLLKRDPNEGCLGEEVDERTAQVYRAAVPGWDREESA